MADYKTVDEYMALLDPSARKKLEQLRLIIREAAPDTMEVIAYRMPTFKLNGKNLVHYAAFKDHISLFPLPASIEAFSEEAAVYKTGKGTLSFKYSEPIPEGLVTKIVQKRIEILNS